VARTYPLRSFDLSEELKALQELELCPSAALVMKPVRQYTDAYAGNDWLSYGYSFVDRAKSTVGMLLGYGPQEPLAQSSEEAYQPMAAPSHPVQDARQRNPTIKTFQTQRLVDDDDVNYYNGNSIDTLPNTDAEDSA